MIKPSNIAIPAVLAVALFSVLISQAQHPWPVPEGSGIDCHINDRSVPKPDGLHYRTYDNGHIYYSGEFVDGHPKPNSDFFWYDYEFDRQLAEVHHITEDPSIINGEKYSAEGIKIAAGQYIRQKKHGVWKFWDEQGNLRSTQAFSNDLEHGESITYYPSGRVFKKESFEEGQQTGEWTEFYERGQKRGNGTFLNGKPHGTFELFYESGASEVRGEYQNGLKEGMWISFLSTGEVEVTTFFKGGTKTSEKPQNGSFLSHYENGIPKDSLTYENGVLNGPFVEWYDKGEWTRVQEPGEKPGMPLQWREKLVGRQVMREGDYLDGKLEGEVTYFSEDGVITRIETYVDGELIETEE